MTELSFLLELLLEHKLEKKTKDLIRDRIKEIEQAQIPIALRHTPMPTKLEKKTRHTPMPTIDHVAQTPEAAKALADRQALMLEARNGSPGRSAPRKLGRQ